jgi:hypothetical protein
MVLPTLPLTTAIFILGGKMNDLKIDQALKCFYYNTYIHDKNTLFKNE